MTPVTILILNFVTLYLKTVEDKEECQGVQLKYLREWRSAASLKSTISYIRTVCGISFFLLFISFNFI